MARRYARTPVSNEEAYQKKLEMTGRYLSPATELLEFGCGTGTTAVHHAPGVKHILAIDISANMLEIARERAAQAGVDNITFQEAAIDSFDAPDASFDVIMGMSILHLLADREQALNKVYRMLKPGGYFISSTVCMANVARGWKLLIRLFSLLRILPRLTFFQREQLLDCIASAGFDIVEDWQPSANEAVFVVARKPEMGSE